MLPLLLHLIDSLPGIGPIIKKRLSTLIKGNTLFDLLLHQPTNAEEVWFEPDLTLSLGRLKDRLVVVKGKVESVITPPKKSQPYKIVCHTKTGFIQLVFFNLFPSQLNQFRKDREVAVLGRFERNAFGENQIVHPKRVIDARLMDTIPKFYVNYPLTEGITQNLVADKIAQVLMKLKSEQTPEWIEAWLLKKNNWPGLISALFLLHHPHSKADLEPQNWLKNNARRRLAYDELLAHQLAIFLAKAKPTAARQMLRYNVLDHNLSDRLKQNLPFALTNTQQKVIKEIAEDLGKTKPMLRLLQGDVGSGKTVVAVFAAVAAYESDPLKQTCVLAPTTILAKQHLRYFTNLLGNWPEFKIELLTSKTTKKERTRILDGLTEGKINLLIGTHAVITPEVKFKQLALAIIDEQHRFGVMQRMGLIEKGESVDTLLMSATPIPRTLMMGLYGDMAISILNEKPANRIPIKTLLVQNSRIEEVHAAVQRALDAKEKIYWVCKAIEESEEESEFELISVKAKYQELAAKFGVNKVGLIHGKMKEAEKEEIMQRFADPNGELQLMVATTVVEVGVDVSDATIIVIEQSETFGLSQLHQLRGRVGRNDKQSYCILLYGNLSDRHSVDPNFTQHVLRPRLAGSPNSPESNFVTRRLKILRESDSGFDIAEADLKLRGSGEWLGTKQSGFPEFKIANLNFDSDLLALANQNAKSILDVSPAHRLLLKLYGYDECLKQSG